MTEPKNTATTKTLAQALTDAGFDLLGGHEGTLSYKLDKDGVKAFCTLNPYSFQLSGPQELLIRLLSAKGE